MTETQDIVVGLTAVVLAVTDEVPRVLVVRRLSHPLSTPAQRGSESSQVDSPDTLPFGPFDPTRHRTLELGLRHWVEEQTGLDLRYVEQLYTFGDQYRDLPELQGGPRVVSIAYLALTHESDVAGSGEADWQDWYRFLPWEDCRDGTPKVVEKVIRPALRRWIRQAGDRSQRSQREERVSVCFGLKAPAELDRIRTLERYELLYEVGLVLEAHRDHQQLQLLNGSDDIPPDPELVETARQLSPPLALDNRRILATALSRIRGKLAYRPVVFELLPKDFTLLQLQRVVEALAGVRLHKQNFRRMLFTGELVEPTGRRDASGRGRPAELYRFRREVMRERSAVGVGLPNLRAAE
ncbi:NAD regulator [Pelagibius sp. Alg239-R121]|uniref:NUDIX hydrolase n=1 Tax=Pelagibius sp. Alg239-R121 TaxID=2993448 RepID=UPI0024A77D79|nr:NAD regulator [Pelagibius sp. Alg239-R121]